ncbi:MAG: Carbohydrate-binding and sugar hydrolysis, partial [Parcubacteria group bacterium]|nr:Carbohydrate-binding and sugar hydrolysis [Parcubacteria group bacterium]
SNNTFKNNISTGNTLRQFSAILGAENAGIYGSGNVYEYNMFGPEASNFIEWGSGVYKSTYSAFDTAYGASTHSVAGDPLFTTNGSNFTLLSTSPAIDTGVNLGTTYKLGLDPTSTWPSSVSTLNQDANGLGWDIGSYVFTESTAPTVSLTAPTTGSSVSGSSVSLSATASDNSAIAGVQFKLDTNTNIGAEDTTSTYGVAWNSTAVSNGTHTLIAVARDTYGNYATSSAVTVTVNNASVVVVSNVTTPARPPGGHKHDVIIAASTSAPALTLTPSTTPTLSPSHSFTTNHQLWDKGPDIKDLQIYLNDHGFTIAGSGSGSKGNETSTFGTLTFKSLVNYQKSKGLPATGWFGPMTREAMGSK